MRREIPAASRMPSPRWRYIRLQKTAAHSGCPIFPIPRLRPLTVETSIFGRFNAEASEERHPHRSDAKPAASSTAQSICHHRSVNGGGARVLHIPCDFRVGGSRPSYRRHTGRLSGRRISRHASPRWSAVWQREAPVRACRYRSAARTQRPSNFGGGPPTERNPAYASRVLKISVR